MKPRNKKTTKTTATLMIALTSLTLTHADAITDWNAHWEEAVFATAQPVPAQARFAAILHVAMFDAVNSIDREYTPYFVEEAPPPGARAEAAAVQAGYTVLKLLYPAHIEKLNQHLAASLEKIPGHQGKSQSIAKGRVWGQHVANQIVVLRALDGWTTPPAPYFGGLNPGMWRSIAVPGNPDGALPAVFAQNATLTPFAMEAPSQFRPDHPYAATLAEALASPQYAMDVNEVMKIGRVDSPFRSADQTELARLWQAVGPVDENRAARAIVPAGNSLVANARLFALLNMATCDALIASMDSKFAHHLWRPYHAIRLADTDGNSATQPDPEWTALILAPRFPEYISNHACLTAAFMETLSELIGDEHTFTLSSPNYPTFSWTFTRCSDAAEQVAEARIWAGIHYRYSCEMGLTVGRAIANYVLDNFLMPLHSNEKPSVKTESINPSEHRAPELPGDAEELQVPAGNQAAFHTYATGVQIYVCQNTSTTTTPHYQWVFKAPEAGLFANAGFDGQVGIHYAGPTWESQSGSKLTAAVLSRKSVSADAIPWLLLRATSADGPGIFSNISYIQRVNTTGGLAPTTPCGVENEGEEVRVPYTAEYYFYRPSHS